MSRLQEELRENWKKHAVFLLVFYATSWVSRMIMFSDAGVASIWLPFGFAIAFLVRFGPQFAVTMLLAEVGFGYLFFGLSPGLNEILALGNTVTVALGYWFTVKVARIDARIRQQREVFVLVFLTALVSPVISATTGSACLVAWDMVPQTDLFSTFIIWWQADVIGILVVTPLLIETFHHRHWYLPARYRLEASALAAVICLALVFIVTVRSGFHARDLAVVYLLFPITIWTAARFEVFTTSLVVATISVVLVIATINELGPFHQMDVAESLFFLQAFTFALATTGLFVAVNTTERRRTADALLQSNMILEDRVKLRTSELESAKLRAEEANHAKSMFLATMSHEIRTPLNGLLGFTDILRNTPLNNEQREHLDTLHHSGVGLLRVINDVLDFSKIEAGRLELDPHSFSIRALVEETIGLFAANARAKGLALTSEVADPVPSHLNADSNRLRQVLSNLIGNAVKFTESGGVDLKVIGSPPPNPANANPWPLRIEVSDTGIGLSPTEIGHLFEPFVQADSSMSRKYGGSGLGLAICRRISEAMGGSINLHSTEGEGTTFIVEIMVETGEASATLPPASAIAEAPTPKVEELAAEQVSVLLVEDNKVNQRVAQHFLNRLGYSAALAENGAEAVEQFKEHDPDIVLMDVQMPVMDGLEAAKSIRTIEATKTSRPPCQIIALTANIQPEDRAKTVAAGMNDFLIKPLKIKDLEGALNKARDQLSARIAGRESRPESSV